MAIAEKLKILNGRTGRKESLPDRDPLRLYTPLPPPLPGSDQPELSPKDLNNPAALRVYYTADLLERVLVQEGRKVQFVAEPEQAEVLILETGSEQSKSSWLVAVLPPNVMGDVGNYTPLEARYLSYSAPHASPIQWSAGALAGARAALGRLQDYHKRLTAAAKANPKLTADEELKSWRQRFYSQLYDDLNTPRAMAVLWTLLQSEVAPASQYSLLVEFCRALGLAAGLGLEAIQEKNQPSPNGQTAHPLPGDAKSPKKPPIQPVTGYEGGGVVKPKSAPPPKPAKAPAPPKATPASSENRRRILTSRDVRSFLDEPDRFDFTVSLIAYNNLTELRPTVESLLHYIPRSSRSIQVVAVEMNGSDGAADYLEATAARYANFRVIYTRDNLGEAAGRNLAFRQGRGRYLLLLDAGLKLVGDLFEELYRRLSQEEAAKPALYGAYHLELLKQGGTIKSFAPATLTATEGTSLEVEAVEGSLLCFRRSLVEEVGFMDEHFRLPYALDLDYSYAFRDKGYAVRVLPGLKNFIERPASFVRPTYGLPPEQQERQRQKNWQTFLRSWQL